MSIAGCYTGRCRDYNPCSRQSPGSARRGRYVNPASSTANVQGRKAPTDIPVREKLRSQPGREDHQAYRYSKGSEGNLKRGRQGQCHTMSIAGSHRNCCRDYKPSSRQSRGSARRGRYANPASSTANVQGRKAQTDDPVRELRSQPGRKDHQAHRNSKGSNPP